MIPTILCAVAVVALREAWEYRKRRAARYWQSLRKQPTRMTFNPWAGAPIEPRKLAEINAERWD